MPVYAYKGLNTQGKNVSGIIDADSPKGARLKLRRTAVYTTDLTEQNQQTGASEKIWSTDLGAYFERITPQDMALMTRQLATLVGAMSCGVRAPLAANPTSRRSKSCVSSV